MPDDGTSIVTAPVASLRLFNNALISIPVTRIADMQLGSDSAPVIEWIRAIENPSGDNSAGFARLKDWESRTDTGRRLTRIPELLLSF